MYTNDIESNTPASSAWRQSEQAAPSLTCQIIRYLRWAGTVLIILSAVGFMLQSHADLLPAYRYWAGLGFALTLCAGGLVCTYLLRETTGARIFFTLGAAFLPVQVSQVSAMIYAFMHGGSVLQPDYSWLQFSGVNPPLIAVDFVITVFLLISVGYTGFSMLARRQVKILMHAFLLGNLLLLLPVRDAFWVPVLIALLFIRLRTLEQTLQQEKAMHLFEGVSARVLTSLPLLILIGRSLLHPSSVLLTAVIAAITATLCLVDIKRYTRSSLVVYAAQWLGTLAALGTWLVVAERFAGIDHGYYGLMLPLSGLLFLLSTQADYHQKAYRFFGSALALILTYGALLNDQAFAPLLALSVGMALSLAGLRYREKAPFFAGQLCFLGSILFYCSYAIDAYSHAPWLSSIGLGLVVLLSASYLEKRQQLIISKVDHYWQALKSLD